jgi:hypothetical protein
MSLWHPTKPAYPIADNTYDLGSSTLRWRGLYLAGAANVGSLQIAGTTVIDSSRNLQNIASIAQSLLPDADNTRALGSSTYRWSDVRTVLLNGWNPDAHASRHAYGGADAVSLDASQITSGRLSLSRIPTSATANRFLVVRTANADPTYDVITAADIPGLDASKIVSGRFTVSRLPDGTSGYVLVGQGTGYDMAWRDISGIAGTITDTQHGTKTGIPFAHHGDWGHYGKIPTSAPTGAAERAYVDSANLYVHDGTSWVLRATKDWNNLINKPSTFPPSTHASTHALGGSDPVSLDASQITSGRLSLSRIPTSATANRVLLVRTANADPTYDQVDWNTDIKNKPSTFPPSAHASTHEYGGTDLVRNLDYLAIRGTTVIDSSRNLVGLASVAQNLVPDVNATRNLGSSTNHFYLIYCNEILRTDGSLGVVASSDLLLASGNTWRWTLQSAGHLVPITDNTYDIGTSTTRVRNLYLAGTANVASATVSGAANVGSLQIGGTTVIDSSRKLQNIASVVQTLSPDADNTYDLGSGSLRWRDIYPVTIKTSAASGMAVYFYSHDGTSYQSCASMWGGAFRISRAGDIYPDADNSRYLGSSSSRWAYFYAVNKSAAFKHPLHNPERYIVFKCVESPKVTVEDWGIAELKNGKAFVGFSEEFVALMSDKAEYAVFLTPEGECNGLYVSKKEFYGFEVRELNNGKSNIRFSWHVKAIRIGDEETPVLEEPAPTEPEKREEWEAKRREADKKKEEDRLNRMKKKIAKYREVTSKS